MKYLENGYATKKQVFILIKKAEMNGCYIKKAAGI